MALAGYSKRTGRVINKKEFVPSDRNIDAETLEAPDLIKLFEPNEGMEITEFILMIVLQKPQVLISWWQSEVLAKRIRSVFWG